MDQSPPQPVPGRDPMRRMTPLGKTVGDCDRDEVLLLARVARHEGERQLTDAVWYESLAGQVAPREPTAKIFIDATRDHDQVTIEDDDEASGLAQLAEDEASGLAHLGTSGLHGLAEGGPASGIRRRAA